MLPIRAHRLKSKSKKDSDFDKRIWRHCACRYESAERMGAFLFFKGLQKVSNGKLRLF